MTAPDSRDEQHVSDDGWFRSGAEVQEAPGFQKDTGVRESPADPEGLPVRPGSWITSALTTPTTPPVREPDPVRERLRTPDPSDTGGDTASAGGSRPLATVAAVLTAVLASLGFGLYDLGHRQLWQDESASWWAATLSWPDFVRLMQHIDVVLAPYYLLLHFWTEGFGTSPAALRMPSVIATAATAGLLVLLGRRLFGTPQGLVAALLYAAVPATTRYAQEARPYAFAVLAAVAATLLLLRALERSSGGRWISYGLMVTCMGLTHLVTLTVLLSHAIVVTVHARREKRSSAQWWLGAFYGVLLLIPILAQGQLESAQVSWISTSWSALPDFPDQLFLSHWAAIGVMAAAVVGLLFQRKQAALLLCWAVAPPVLLFATRNQLDLFLARYMLFTIPAWTLLASAGLCTLAARLTPVRGRAFVQTVLGVLAAAGLVLGTLPDLTVVHANPLAGQPDFQSAGAFIAQREQPGDGIAVGGYSTQPLRLTDYMLRKGTVPDPVFLSRTPQQAGTYTGQPCPDPSQCARSTDRIWLVTTTPTDSFYEQMPTLQSQVLKTQFHVQDKGRFTGNLRVYLFVRNTPAGAA